MSATMNSTILARMSAVETSHSAEAALIEGVTDDSRKAGRGKCFVAVRGGSTDGHGFIPDVVSKGASLIVGEDIPDGLKAPWIKVADSRMALAVLAAECNDDPTSGMLLTGITGTDGKTSTAILIEAGLIACGIVTGLVGTVVYRYAGVEESAPMTTPGPVRLQGLFSTMRDAGVKAAVMEVSSHALDQKRVDGSRLDCAVFTNLTRDHLDYHQTHEAYAAAKMRLFTEVLPSNPDALGAVVNADDPMAKRIVGECPLPVLTFSLQEGGGDIHPVDVEFTLDGIKARLAGPWGTFDVSSRLIGSHNLCNIMSAIGTGWVTDMTMEPFVKGIAGVSTIPGRLERVDGRRPVKVFVDYAHTPKALENVLGVLMSMVGDSQITAVVGAGGDRDRGKRPLMGQAAVTGAHKVVVTSDNPRTEDPASIIRQIMDGVEEADRTSDRTATCEVEQDRRKAIGIAIEEASDGDVVLIAGKGHEDYQEIGRSRIHFSDTEVAGEFLDRV